MSEVNLLPEPKFVPELHPTFRPAVLANRAFEAAARDSGAAVETGIALEQADGSVFHTWTVIFAEGHALAENNFRHLERLVKFLLWSRGGWRIHLAGPASLAERLQRYYRETELGKFDNEVIGFRNFGKSLEVVACDELPVEKVDERLTTYQAESDARATGRRCQCWCTWWTGRCGCCTRSCRS